MLDAITVTLATGRYADLAASLLRSLALAGNATLAVTDRPEVFDAGVETVPYVPDEAHIWHSKRHAVRVGLDRAWTTYFIDADHELREGMQDRVPKLARLVPGVGSCCGGVPPLGRFAFPILRRRPLFAPETACVLDHATAHLSIGNWRGFRWSGDWLYSVTRDEAGAWQGLCPLWDRFAAFTVHEPSPHPLVLGDGIALTFAAAACGLPVMVQPALASIAHAFRHLNAGAWRENGRPPVLASPMPPAPAPAKHLPAPAPAPSLSPAQQFRQILFERRLGVKMDAHQPRR
jgi:hypothetical protein